MEHKNESNTFEYLRLNVDMATLIIILNNNNIKICFNLLIELFMCVVLKKNMKKKWRKKKIFVNNQKASKGRIHIIGGGFLGGYFHSTIHIQTHDDNNNSIPSFAALFDCISINYV